MDTLISKMPAISRIPWISRMVSQPRIALIGVVALLLALVCGVTAWMLSGSGTSAVNPNEVVNTAGHYQFELPTGWTTTQEGRTTTVTSPDKITVVSFGVGHIGPIPQAGTQFFKEVAGHYKNVQGIPPEAKTIGQRLALVYGGVGDNAENTRVRFLTITVENKPANYAITVFTVADSDPDVVLPTVNRLVDSFRPAA